MREKTEKDVLAELGKERTVKINMLIQRVRKAFKRNEPLGYRAALRKVLRDT